MNRRSYKEHYYKRYISNGQCCYYCKRKIEFDFITLDHVIAKSKGGGGSRKNKVFACVMCNSHKQSLTPYQFRERMCNIIGGILRRGKNHYKGYSIDELKNIIKTCTALHKKILMSGKRVDFYTVE